MDCIAIYVWENVFWLMMQQMPTLSRSALYIWTRSLKQDCPACKYILKACLWIELEDWEGCGDAKVASKFVKPSNFAGDWWRSHPVEDQPSKRGVTNPRFSCGETSPFMHRHQKCGRLFPSHRLHAYLLQANQFAMWIEVACLEAVTHQNIFFF